VKNRIVWKFFSAFAALIIIVVLILNFFISSRLRDNFEQRLSEQLRGDAILVGNLLGTHLDESEQKDIQQEAAQLAEKLDLRITVVDEQGRVLADSETEPSSMANHGDRPEIIEALKSGFGQSARFSDTLGYSMKYVAVRAGSENSPPSIIRFALPLSRVQLEIRVIYRVVLFGAIAAVGVALIAAYFVSRSITLPVRQMKETAERIAKGDFGGRVRIKSQDEFGELAKSFNIMADELEQMIESLRLMDKMRTDFVASVSHELKTPLTLIKGYTETLENKGIEDKKTTIRFISIIKEHSDRLGKIVNDLLSLSELELSKDCVNKEEFDLKELIDDVVLGFGLALDRRKQKLAVDVQSGDCRMRGDRNRIGQVLVNLIDNAIKYTPESGRIELIVCDRDGQFCLSVQDNGIGIAAEHIDRVFERFYRVDKARSRELGGTGLGLSIAKHIVLAHNGKISIESRPRMGTKVTVTLPKE